MYLHYLYFKNKLEHFLSDTSLKIRLLKISYSVVYDIYYFRFILQHCSLQLATDW